MKYPYATTVFSKEQQSNYLSIYLFIYLSHLFIRAGIAFFRWSTSMAMRFFASSGKHFTYNCACPKDDQPLASFLLHVFFTSYTKHWSFSYW